MEGGPFRDDKVAQTFKKVVAIHAMQDGDAAVHQAASQRWGQGIRGIPAMKFAMPDGTEIEEMKQIGYIDAKPLCARIEEAVKKAGPGIGADEWARYKAMWEEIGKQVGEGHVKKAVELLKKLGSVKVKCGFVEDVAAKLEELARKGDERLAEGKAKEDEKAWKEAYAIYKEIADQYVAFPAAGEAKKRMAELMKNAEAKAAIQAK